MRFRVLLTLLAVLALTGCEKQRAQSYRIGVIAVQSGDMAFLGKAARHAVEMAAGDEQAAGRTVEVLFEDDALQPARSAAAARKLIEVDKVDALIAFTSSTANAVAPLAAAARVPTIAIASDPRAASFDYNVVNITTPDQEATLMAAELKRRKIDCVALFALKGQWGDISRAALATALGREGIRIAWQDTFAGGEKNFRVKLARLKDAAPKTVIVLAYAPELDLIIRQCGEVLPGTEITSLESFDFVGDRSLVEGKWMVTVSLGNKAFRSRVRNHTGGEPMSGAAFAYDSLGLLSRALHTASGDRAKAFAWLCGVKEYHGAVGALTVGPSRVAIAPAAVVTMRGGSAITSDVAEENGPGGSR